MTNAITDFMTYCQCYQIPQPFTLWGGISLMAASYNRRVYVRKGDKRTYGQMYVWLVGEQGDRKSTVKDFAREIYKEVFPTIPIGPSVTSKEDIVKFMSGEGARALTSPDGEVDEYHPYMFFINEMSNFLSYNIAGMIDFLTDIYDAPYYDSSTIKRSLEAIKAPCINILGCTTPKWMEEKMKAAIVTGGICRRTILVYAITNYKADDAILIPRPYITPEATAARQRVIDHLIATKEYTTEYKWTKAGQLWFDDWYRKLWKNLPDDPLLRGFLKSKDDQLYKVAMAWDAASSEPKKLLTDELLALSDDLIRNTVEKNLSKLSVAAGRNELAGPQQRLLEAIETAGGKMPAQDVGKCGEADLNPAETFQILRHLQETGRLKKIELTVNGSSMFWWMTTRYFNDAIKSGELQMTQQGGGLKGRMKL